jgi:hypothetical protein
VDTPDDTDWLIIDDFNLIRASSNRNKPGANMQEIFAFNEAISSLGLVELPLKGMKYTWSNMQPPDPLLVKLDCFFTSSSWTCNYPGTYVSTLSGIHVPCVVNITTEIPKGNLFRFENYWLHHEQFNQVMMHGWSIPTYHLDKARILGAKFKNLRRVLRHWHKQISNLASTIAHSKELILLIDKFEEF